MRPALPVRELLFGAAVLVVGVLGGGVVFAEAVGGPTVPPMPTQAVGSVAGAGAPVRKQQKLPCRTPVNPYAGARVRRLLARPGLTVRSYHKAGRTPLFVAVANVGGTGPRVQAGPLLRGGVSALTTLRTKIAGSGAYLAANGDFFHLGQDGSPNGVEVTRGGVVRKGTSQPQSSFIIQRNHAATVGAVRLTIPIRTPAGTVDGQSYNSQYLPTNGIAVFTPAWGVKARNWLHPHRPVREFVLAGNRVRSVHNGVTATPIPSDGAIVVAQGRGAARLAAAGLTPGAAASIATPVLHSSAAHGVDSAIGIGLALISHGVYLGPVCSVDRPVARTIIGILPGGTRMFIAVAQGQTDSAHHNFSGLTAQQATALARHLGATTAVMLDGGGSAGMVATNPDGSVSQYTHSADGWNRYIPNGYAFWPP
jgi:hypothetical protein